MRLRWCICTLLLAPLAWAQGDDEARAPRPTHVEGEILVKFREDAPPGRILDAARAVKAAHVRSFGRLGIRHWRLGNGVDVEKALEILAKPGHARFLEYAEPNWLWQAHELPDDPLRGSLWGLDNVGQTGGTPDADIDAPEAWDIEKGSAGIVVGVIDTGVDYTHPDLAANIWTNPGEIPDNGIDDDGNGYVDDVRGWDFVNGDNDPMDDNSHGTHVSGTIGALGNNALGVVGVNWTVRIMPLKFLGAGGSGSTSDAISAVQYAASFVDGQGNPVVRITSNSWGGGNKSRALENAIRDSGALFVASAGNDGNSRKLYPAAYALDNVIAVAATDHDDALASFSSYGSWVHLAAPGVDTLSTVLNDGYGTKSGTSMACPHVSGTCALVLAHFGTDNADVKSRVLGGVDAVGSLAGLVSTGGRLNAFRALGGVEPPPSDFTPPAAVTTLAVDGAATGHASVKLDWIAVGDDGNAGQASFYDLRYRTDGPVTDANWDSSTEAAGEPLPQPSGAAESHVVVDLAPETAYWFALKVLDDAGNVSDLSNVVSATTTAPPAGAWASETVVTAGGFYRGVDFDAANEPAVGYSGESDDVRFAFRTGGAWSNELVDPNAGSSGAGVDFAFAPDGAPTLSYGWGKLKFARKSGGSWSLETIESKNAYNDYTSLRYDPAGDPAISYVVTRGKGSGLKLARRPGGAWQTETVDPGAGARYSSLAFDPAGHPAIAYSDDIDGDGWLDTLKLARSDGASWQISVVETGVRGYGVHASLAFDVAGNPAMVHAASQSVRFVKWDGAQWSVEIVASGSGCTLAYDPLGTPHIGFNDAGATRVAVHDGTAWQVETIDPLGGGKAVLRMDRAGNPAVLHNGRPGLELARKQ